MSEHRIPTVSVLMPLYNCGAYVAQTLQSLRAQHYENFEAILINDGSTDDTADVVAAVTAGDPRFRLVHQPNQGIVAALNHAMALARGKYLARLDGDDIARADRFALQVAYLDAHPNCVCVGSLYRTIDESGQVRHLQRVFSVLRKTDVLAFPPQVTTLPHPSIMLRGDVLRALGGYRAHFPHAEDFDLYLRLAERGELGIVPQHLLDYRVHGGSLSGKHFQRQLDSATAALVAACLRAEGRPDPFEGAAPPQDLDSLWAALDNPARAHFLRSYHALRLVEAHMNRSQLAEAQSALGKVLCAALRDLPRALDGRYWRVLLLVARYQAKILLERRRCVPGTSA